MGTSHRATAKQWDRLERWADSSTTDACVLELRARIEALEAGATCPHVVSSDEGTSYCALAEATARIGQPDVPANTSTNASAKPTSNPDQIRSSLVEQVAAAIHPSICADPNLYLHEARAAIRAVAEWLRGQQELGAQTWAWHLEQEAAQ